MPVQELMEDGLVDEGGHPDPEEGPRHRGAGPVDPPAGGSPVTEGHGRHRGAGAG
jgi:hypothetical protein